MLYHSYPLHFTEMIFILVEVLFARISGGVYICKLDLIHAYQPLPLDKVLQLYVVINTPRGLL